jgi:phage tail sheath gpL-like
MPIVVPGVPTSRKTPGINFNVVLGGPGTSSGAAAKSIMLLGNMLPSAITGASPTLSVAAGSASAATVVSVPSEADAITLFGQGSELHRMTKQVFAQYPDATLYACPVAEASGTRASAALTFVNAATAAFTIRMKICGVVFDVPVASGAAIATISEAVADAINDQADLPVTAQFALGVTTITAKQKGPRGNWIIVDAYFVAAGSTIETRITTSAVTSPGATTTGQWSGNGTVYGNTTADEVPLGSGATQDDFTAALAAIEPTRYDRIVVACVEATNLALVVTHVNTNAGPTVQLLEQAISGTTDTYANAVTLASARNASRLQVVWHYASVIPPWELAAQVAAARLNGDAGLGGFRAGEASDPAANLDGIDLASVLMQRVPADRPTATEVENALNNGLTVVSASSSRPGYGALTRSITSRSLASGVPNYAVIDTAYVTVCDHVADDLRSYLTSQLAGAKLGADAANGQPASRAPNVTTPSIIRSLILAKLYSYEESGITRDVTLNASLLAVEADGVVSGRVNCEIPVEPITALHHVVGNLRQQASL